MEVVLLSRDEQLALVLKAKAGDLQSRNEVIMSCWPYILTMARRYKRTKSHDVDDLVHEGILGMMHAIDKFDPSRGSRS